jgi:hypothetical protein
VKYGIEQLKKERGFDLIDQAKGETMSSDAEAASFDAAAQAPES